MADQKTQLTKKRETLVPESIPEKLTTQVPLNQALDRLRLKVQIEKETKLGEIEKINHRETPLKQEEALVALGIRTKMLIIKLMNEKIITSENITAYSQFPQFLERLTQIDIGKLNLNKHERRAILDLTFFNPSSSLYTFWKGTWPGLILAAKKWQTELTSNVKSDKWTDKVKTFYQENRLACHVAGLGLLAGGLYLLFRKKKAKTEAGVQKSVASSWAIAGATIAGIGAAAYFGWDWLKKELKSLGLNFNDLKEMTATTRDIKQQVDDLKKDIETGQKTYAEEGAAAAVIDYINKGETKPEELHRQYSTVLKEYYEPEIDTRAFVVFEEMNYKKFRDEVSTDRIGEQGISMINFIRDLDMDAATKAYLASSTANLNRIFQTLEENKTIDPKYYEGKTVKEVLDDLMKKHDQNELEKIKINLDTIDIAAEAAEEVVKSYSGFLESFLSDAEFMADTLGNGAVRQVAQGWKARIETGEFTKADIYNMPADIMRACYENGVPLMLGGGTMALWNGLKWMFFARAIPVARAAGELLSNGYWPGDWKAKEALKIYGITSSPLVVLGMTKGAFLSKGARIKGTLLGGGKRLLRTSDLTDPGH